MREHFGRLVADESGQGLVEYALIIALVSIGLIAALTLLKNSISGLFNKINTKMNSLS